MKEALGIRLKKRAQQLKQDIPVIYLVWKDQDTPLAARLVVGCTILYALSPIDLVPDVIPVLGLLDDVILLPALILLAIRLIPEDIWERNRLRAAEMKLQRMETKWYFALPVLALWLLLFFLIIKVLS
ncbi:MAG: DUF1232 domain-containing protein [Clostridium sp.]|nr:DUF1232 domain-containing protein [Clostridium sp.]